MPIITQPVLLGIIGIVAIIASIGLLIGIYLLIKG